MRSRTLFQDRTDAGRQLALQLVRYRTAAPVVLGLPRGGVPVAYEVARALDAPLDVCVVRKLGAPMQPELGLGAVAEEGAFFLDRDLVDRLGVSTEELTTLIQTQRAEVADRVRRFRRGAPPLDVRGKTVLVVDDGIATGGTARAAMQTLRERGAGRVVLVAPVGASDSVDALRDVADEIVCLHSKDDFSSVGRWYDDFEPTTDDEVVALLDRARAERDPATRPRSEERAYAHVARNVSIPVEAGVVEGTLSIPPNARGLVIFAHGSGSGRRSPRNQYVAGVLQNAGFATLLFDLLTEEEERIDAQTGELRFDIDFLASRLVVATDWALQDPQTRAFGLGYFGASTGAAAALVASVQRSRHVHAVVSRGGRPDLAAAWLSRVRAPTLLLVGGNDADVVDLNQQALDMLTCEKRLEIVEGATHLFEEPGALEQVANAAARWLRTYLGERVLESAT